MFRHDTAMLLAILALNNRQTEADHFATEALKEWDDPQFRKELDEARNGQVPPPPRDPD